MLNNLSEQHLNTITLWYLVQHSMTGFNTIKQYFGSVEHAVTAENLLRWQDLPLHKNHVERARHFMQPEQQAKFQSCLQTLQQQCDFICTPDDSDYPQQLLHYLDHPPILFGQGHAALLNQAQIALVGSRKASKNGLQTSYDFAYYLAEKGFVITSGLAEGVDSAAHHAALTIGQTIAVMATGIEQTYPKKNHTLRQQILKQNGTLITEFLPFTPPLKSYFPRRNRIVSGLSLGVVVTEASLNSGSLITAKLAAEQGKVIFAVPGHIHNQAHQGCHHLIREGAILVDHPEKIIEDLALPTQWQYEQSTPQQSHALPEAHTIPTHLTTVYDALDWDGQDLDQLANKTQLSAHHLLAQLMELELLNKCIQQFGRYSRTPR